MSTGRKILSIELREVADSDVPIFFDQQNEEAGRKLGGGRSRDHSSFMEHWAKIRVDPTVTVRTVTCDTQVAGYFCAFNRIGKREVGYWLGEQFWGKGVATAALNAFLRVETARPLVAHTSLENPGSQRVLLKCGFKARGTERYFLERLGHEVEDLLFVLES